ncbi:TerD family protein [Paenibacillus campi]|uniref:TerD family protein n=1 Tax=Paenibacillus campi TaxID=3106031 RepID=UPI002AFF0476|nr:TerD family protein [Paenibacillus sp. SGZ-1009]
MNTDHNGHTHTEHNEHNHSKGMSDHKQMCDDSNHATHPHHEHTRNEIEMIAEQFKHTEATTMKAQPTSADPAIAADHAASPITAQVDTYHTSQWINPILLRRAGQLMMPANMSEQAELKSVQQFAANVCDVSDAVRHNNEPSSRYTNTHPEKSAIETTDAETAYSHPLCNAQQMSSIAILASLLQDIAQLGYTFAPALIEQCHIQTPEHLVELHRQIVPVLRQLVGDHVRYEPMYPNFPAQVMAATAAELYINALLHYRFGIRPTYDVMRRPPAEQVTELKPIDLATADTCIHMLRNLAAANGSLSTQDKDDLAIGLREVEQVEWLLPERIPYKENAAFIAAVLLETGRANGQRLSVYFRTATDVLRLAAGLSGLDTDMAWAKKLSQLRQPFANPYHLTQALNVPTGEGHPQSARTAYHFRKFRRAERRLLLSLLERTNDPLEDMVLYREQWKRLGELLHPGEMRTRYPRAFAAFTALRRERSIVTIRTEIEQGMKERDPAVIARLGTRPGELARRLDALLRSQPERSALIMEQFKQHRESMAVPLLLQMLAHFNHRQQRSRYRVFFPKGNMGKVVAIPDRLPALDSKVTTAIVQTIRDELKRRFAQRPALGSVYIDPQLQHIPVPLAQRSASRALRALPRGSRVPLPAGHTVRLFCWWRNMADGANSRVDIDLSAVLLDRNWQPLETLAFYNLQAQYGVHSGDIVDAPEGASEFIDLYLAQIQQQTRARYILVQLSCFTGQAMSELPECFAGFMVRDDRFAGEIYEPATVQTRFDLTVEAQQAVPFVLDLQERQMIWLDAVPRNRSFRVTAADNMTSLQMLGHAFTNLRRPMLAELFRLHAEARGKVVEQIEAADIVFAMNEGITPYQTDVILAEYL